MKKFTVAAMIMALALVAVSAPAQAAVEVEGDVYVGIFDKYMWRGFDLSNSQPVAQGGVDVSAMGFTLSYWSNVQLSNGCSDGEDCALQSDEVTETDITLDYTHSFGPVSVSVGDIYYNFNVPGNTHELYLGVAGDVILSPSFTIYYDWDIANDLDYDGLYYSFGVSHGFDLMDKVSLGLGATANYNDESPFVGEFSDWHNYELSGNLDYAFTDQLSVSASVVFSSGISDDAKEAIDSTTATGVTVTFAF